MKFCKSLYNNAIVVLCLVFIISFAFFYSIQFSIPRIVGVDGYFHIKFSYLMRHQGFISSLPWLQYTIYKDYFRDHHFLYHLLYIPFTFFNLITGAKLAAVVFPSLATSAFYWLLNVNKVKFAFIWTLFFLISSHSFIYRMCMPRVQSISLLFLILGILFIMKKKYIALSILSFFFVWLYDGYFMLIVIVTIFFYTRLLIEKERDLKLLIYFFAGLFLGMVINPYFPGNIESYIFNIIRVSKDSGDVNIGREWNPHNTWFMLKDSGLTWALFFSAFFFSLIFGIKNKAKSAPLLLISLFFFFLVFRSRRSFEYWPPFCILFSAFAWDGLLPFKTEREIFAKKPFNIFLIVFAITLFGIFSVTNFKAAKKDIQFGKALDYYKGAALWLKENSEPETTVFNTDWDDFPQLFYYNSENYYIVGLDANYMYKFDPDKYMIWKKITRGYTGKPSTIIKKQFNANYIVTDNDHHKFIKRTKKDRNCKLVFKDKYCTVFKIIESRE